MINYIVAECELYKKKGSIIVIEEGEELANQMADKFESLFKIKEGKADQLNFFLEDQLKDFVRLWSSLLV
jgi:hypothetical protein